MKIAGNITILRRKNNLTQEKLAEICHVSRSAVAQWESGCSTPTLETVSKLASVLGTTIDELVHADLGIIPNDINLIEYMDSEKLKEEIKKEILEELRNNYSVKKDLFEAYCDGENFVIENELSIADCLGIATGELHEGRLEEALLYFESALLKGETRILETIITIHQEIMEIHLMENNISEYWRCRFEFAKKIQQYGKILEKEILNGHAFQ